MLPQKFYPLEGQKQCVQGTAALFGGQGCVGPLAVEDDLIAIHRQALFVHTGVRSAVHHQGYIDVTEVSVIPHGDFGAPGLLGRGSVDYHLKGFGDSGVF